MLEPITEIIYEYCHNEDGTYINKCSSGRLVSDCKASGSVITVFAFMDNVENFYIWGIECKNYKEYVNMYKAILNVEFEDLFKEIDKTTYDEIFDHYVSNINS